MLEWTLAEFVLGWSESFLFFFWNWIEQGLQFPRPFGGEVRSCHWKFIKFGPNSHNQLETLQSKIPVWLCAAVQLSIWRHQTFWQLTAVLSIEQETSLGVFFVVPCSWDGDAGADRCCCQQWGVAPCLQPHFHVESRLWCMSKNKASDLSCLTALSTCPTVQIHKHLACLPSSQGSHVSLCPTSGDFWLDIADIRAHPAPHPQPHLLALLSTVAPPAAQKHKVFLFPLLKQGLAWLPPKFLSHQQQRVWQPKLRRRRGEHCAVFASFRARLVLTSRHFAHNSLPVKAWHCAGGTRTQNLCAEGIMLSPRTCSLLAHAVWTALGARSLAYHAFWWNLDSNVKILHHTIKVAFPCPLAHQSFLVNRALSSLAFAVWNNWSLQLTCQQ